MTVYWPNGSLARPHVTSDYDPARKNPVTGIVQAHNGIDLIGWTDNCSPVDGTVVFAGYNGGAGNEVRIRADGPTAFHVGDYYRILHHASLYVSTGQRVTARQPVGRMGTTGQSTGVHCHFETHEWRLWNPVNPTDYMARANAGTPAGGDGTPFDPEGFLMALSDTQQRQMYEALVVGGQSASAFYMPEAIVNVLRGEIAPAIAAIAAGGIMYPGAGYAAFPALANAIREGRGDEAIEVDEAELAKSLAPALAPLIADNLGTLSDSTIDALVKKLLDEQAKRLAS